MNEERRGVNNVVLITVDSLRADALPPSRSDGSTPTFQRLASEGTVFQQAFAHGNWTPMSFPSIMASRPVFADTGRIGVTGRQTLAETLSEAGVKTAGFNAANGFLTSHWGYDDGFDDFEAFIDVSGDHKYSELIAAHPTLAAWLKLATSPFKRLRARLSGRGDELPFTDTSHVLDMERRVEAFIERLDDDDSFFLWLHYMDTHTPYVPAPRYLKESTDSVVRFDRMLAAQVRAGLGWAVGEKTLENLKRLYRGAVRQVDDSLGRVLSTLSSAGVADETAVVVTGDHGEEFMEHGHLAHYPKLYEELIHVPLLVSLPDGSERQVPEHVGLDSIPPTVCDLLGIEPDSEWDGNSLRPVLEGEESPDEAPVMSVTVMGEDVTQQPIPRSLEDGDLVVSARTGEWTYIENVATGEGELYHRLTDPDEQVDLIHDDEALGDASVAFLRDAIRTHADEIRTADTGAGTTPEYDASEEIEDDIEQRLDALGYR